MATEIETIPRPAPATPAVPTEPPRVPLARSLGYHVRQLSESWTDAMHKATEKRGVTEGQWRYLRELWEEDGLSQRELSERVGRQGPSTVAAVKLLERNGLVTVVPNPDDRRKTGVFLTPRGRALQAELGPAILAVQQIGLEGIAAADLETFKRVLVAIQRNLDDHNKSRNFWSGSRTEQLAKEVGV